MRKGIIGDILRSAELVDALHSFTEVLSFIDKRNSALTVNIRKIPLASCVGWHYSETEGAIVNDKNAFFSITGLLECGQGQTAEQPIILQQEIGMLGIICKKFDGILYFLMQAKIEPGNINAIQISPTIQATRSNFTQQHGGAKPLYLDNFINATSDKIIVDQLQSEQSSRFLKKRNRNIIIECTEDIEVSPAHIWLTLGQIKKLMHFDNLVNMDTRTVLSCIPYSADSGQFPEITSFKGADTALLRSMFKPADRGQITAVFNKLNDMKMFDYTKRRTVPLFSLSGWEMQNDEFCCKMPYPFKVIFCDIEIEAREVRHWCQPLFEATEIAVFGLFTTVDNGVRKFLVQLKREIGCLDVAELAPSVQDCGDICGHDSVYSLFNDRLAGKSGVLCDVLLSEEGGRFYHEQNRNVIVEIDKEEIKTLPDNYFWCDYATLNYFVQFNNCLNIQLRNLLSLLEVQHV